MELVSLINLYKYSFDVIDVYDYKTDEFMFSVTPNYKLIDANTVVRNFNVYTEDIGIGRTILEIWV